LDLRVTAGAALRHLVRLLRAGASIFHGAEDLRDDLARARDLDPIPLANVLRADQLGVVQRGVGYRYAANLDRLEHRIRVQGSRTSHVEANLEQFRDLDLGREFARDRPARLPIANRAKLGIEGALVDFDSHAVRAIVERGEERLE